MGMGEVTVARIMTVEAIGTVMRTVTAADEARTETVPFPALYRVQPSRSNSHFSRPEILKQMQPPFFHAPCAGFGHRRIKRRATVQQRVRSVQELLRIGFRLPHIVSRGNDTRSTLDQFAFGWHVRPSGHEDVASVTKADRIRAADGTVTK
jgi:hypothetical protein